MVRLVLLGIVVGLIVAGRYLPWWAWPIGLVGLVVVLKLFGRRLLDIPFRMKGSALRGATVTVDRVQSCAPPPDASAPSGSVWWELEASVTPGGDGAFKTWEPGELVMVVAGADPRSEGLSIVGLELDIEGGETASLGVAAGWQADQGWKLPGKRRVRFKVAAPASARRLAFRYYFESFGAVDLPAPAAASA